MIGLTSDLALLGLGCHFRLHPVPDSFLITPIVNKILCMKMGGGDLMVNGFEIKMVWKVVPLFFFQILGPFRI